MTDIVERLRREARGTPYEQPREIMREAADALEAKNAEIERLCAEIAKLREALETCASELEHEIRASHDEKYCGHPAMDRRLERDLQSVRDARTALQKDERE